jgi:hypothetical protein
MNTWMWIALASVVAAIAAPLVMRALVRRDPAKDEASQRERQEIVGQATEILEGMVRTLRDGSRVPTGPGTPVHDAIGQLRPRMRKSFTLTAVSEFDREIGYELNRPGVLTLGVDTVATRVERALRALRDAVAR